MVRYLSGGGGVRRYSRAEIMEATEVERAPDVGGLRRYTRADIERGEAAAIQETGIPTGGSTATIERGEAEAIQETGIQRGAVRRQQRERKQMLYKKRGSKGEAVRQQ